MYGAEMDGYVSGNNDQQIYYIISEAANKVIFFSGPATKRGGGCGLPKVESIIRHFRV